MLTIHIFFIFGLIICYVGGAFRMPLNLVLKEAEPCREDNCQPPNCRCSGLALPKKEFRGHEREIPQFITVTFDDAVNSINYQQYQELFTDLYNPDQCEAKATFFVSHEYTDYSKLNALYNEGHEIALHSITHGTGTEYWRHADVDLIMREFGNQIDILEEFAKINRRHIRGMRLPFLQLSGNNSFIAAKRLGLLYDSSWPTQQYRKPAMWPYTLNYLSTQDCQIPPCPTVALSGFWINPMVSWMDKEGYSCSMLDGCIYLPEDEVESLLQWMKENFHRHYDNNRAPFGMYLHAAWFGRSANYFKAFRNMRILCLMLYVTTTTAVIQYMKRPLLGKPFKGCFKKPQTICRPLSCALLKHSTGEMRYMTVCDRCPEIYPWLDNPLGEIYR